MTIEGDGGSNRNKTVFRPSPLQRLKKDRQERPRLSEPEEPDWGASPSTDPGYGETTNPGVGDAQESGGDQSDWNAPAVDNSDRPAPPSQPAMEPSRLGEDDVPVPTTPREVRNLMLAEASPLLALAAGIRSGRVRMQLAPVPPARDRCNRGIRSDDRPALSERNQAAREICLVRDDRRYRAEPAWKRRACGRMGAPEPGRRLLPRKHQRRPLLAAGRRHASLPE